MFKTVTRAVVHVAKSVDPGKQSRSVTPRPSAWTIGEETILRLGQT
jgi:hypothetical protein